MTNFDDKLAERIVAQIKREGFLPAVTAAPAADSLRPEVTKVAADVDKLTVEVDELKQLVKTMTTKLDEHREYNATRFDKQRQLIRMSFALVIAIVFGIQWTLTSMIKVDSVCPKYCECMTLTEASFKLVNMTAHLSYDVLKFVYDILP